MKRKSRRFKYEGRIDDEEGDVIKNKRQQGKWIRREIEYAEFEGIQASTHYNLDRIRSPLFSADTVHVVTIFLFLQSLHLISAPQQ